MDDGSHPADLGRSLQPGHSHVHHPAFLLCLSRCNGGDSVDGGGVVANPHHLGLLRPRGRSGRATGPDRRAHRDQRSPDRDLERRSGQHLRLWLPSVRGRGCGPADGRVQSNRKRRWVDHHARHSAEPRVPSGGGLGTPSHSLCVYVGTAVSPLPSRNACYRSISRARCGVWQRWSTPQSK